jgi:hypothetical protein
MNEVYCEIPHYSRLKGSLSLFSPVNYIYDRLGHLWTLALRHYIHLYFFLDTTYFGVVSGVFLVLDAGFVLILHLGVPLLH